MRGYCAVGISLFLLFNCVSLQAVMPPEGFGVWDWPHQCHGDTDGVKNGLFWVSTSDLSAIQALYGKGWPLIYPTSPFYDPRVDFDRNFIVNDLDVAIIEQWYGKTNVPGDCGKKLAFDTADSQCLLSNASNTVKWIWRIYTQHIPTPGEEDYPGTFSLYYSTNNGTTWQYIATVSQQTSYEWFVPQAVSGACLLKITDDEHTGLMDTMSVNVSQCQENIVEDFNSDCYVNLLDMAVIGQYWLGECSSANNWCGGADFDLSTTVDFPDLSTFVQNWLRCANPCDSACSLPQ
jgi:hypothetical protein